MCIRKMKGSKNIYAFSTLCYGVSIMEVNTKQKTVAPLNRFLRGKTVRDLCEYSKGKFLCGASCQNKNEIWSVDYLNEKERKLCDTFGSILTIRRLPESLFPNLYLVREKEWLCVFNLKFRYYTRILKIPHFIYRPQKFPTNQYMELVPLENSTYQDIFAIIIWGTHGRKVAKIKIEAELLEFLNTYNPREGEFKGI